MYPVPFRIFIWYKIGLSGHVGVWRKGGLSQQRFIIESTFFIQRHLLHLQIIIFLGALNSGSVNA